MPHQASPAAVRLEPGPGNTRKAIALNPGARFELLWTRYQQLSHTARAVDSLRERAEVKTVLDVGSTDGASALFLPHVDVYTASVEEAEGSFDAVICSELLEDLEPRRRGILLAQMTQLCKTGCVVTFPLPSSSTAQKAVAALTGNSKIAERVRMGLPYSSTVRKNFEDSGMQCSSWQHSSRTLWVAFSALEQSSGSLAHAVSRYLIEEQPSEVPADPLFETLVAVKGSARKA